MTKVVEGTHEANMKVLVPIEGSEFSQAALETVINREWPDDTEIRLLNVIRPVEMLIPLPDAQHSKVQQHEDVKATRELLHDIAGDISPRLPKCHVDSLVLVGHIQESIVQHAKDWGADLIVVGSHGRKGIDLVLLGSVSRPVLEHAPCPVLTVRSPKNDEEMTDFFRVLIAVDGSSFSRSAVDWVASQRWKDETRFKLVMAVPLINETYTVESHSAKLLSEWEAGKIAAMELVEDLATKLEERLGDRTGAEVQEGDPKQIVLDKAAQFHADLIILGSHGRTGLTKFLLGSVSQAVATRAACSVLIIKPGRDSLKTKEHTGEFQLP